MRHVEHRAQHVADAVARAHRHAGRQRRPSRATSRSGSRAAPPCRSDRPSPWAGRAPAATRPCSAEALVNSVDSLEHTPSTQWSTARMPVERNSHIGVWRVTSGSRITACGMVSGWRNSSFTLVASLVTPAMPENSPADSVVGIEICAHRRRLHVERRADRVHRLDACVTSLARQSWTALAPSVIEPPPRVTIRSALRLARLRGGGDDGRARRVRRHLVEGADALVAERPADLLDLVGLAVERAAHHQEHALGAAGLHQLGDRSRRPACRSGLLPCR